MYMYIYVLGRPNIDLQPTVKKSIKNLSRENNYMIGSSASSIVEKVLCDVDLKGDENSQNS